MSLKLENSAAYFKWPCIELKIFLYPLSVIKGSELFDIVVFIVDINAINRFFFLNIKGIIVCRILASYNVFESTVHFDTY